MTDGAVSITANNRMLIFVDKADSQITPISSAMPAPPIMQLG